jgi:hypothetical protein
MSLRYRADRPFEVVARFPGSVTGTGTPAVWCFARDLLRDGLFRPAGLGDVRVRPQGPVTVVELHGCEGRAHLWIATSVLAEFVRASAALVPFGEEGRVADWDAGLAQLLQPE